MSAFCVLIRGVRAVIPTELLLRLMNATPEQYAAVERVLGMKVETLKAEKLKTEIEVESEQAARGDARPTTAEVARNLYRQAGSHWDVRFAGGTAFHLEDTVGAHYLDYLLHHRGEVISRTTLYEHLFDENDDTLSNLVDVHIFSIRKKLRADLIATRRGQGYCIEGGSPA